MNVFKWFVAITVSRQSISWYRVLNVRTRCILIILIFSKVSCGFQWTMGHLVTSYHLLGSMLGLMYMDAVLCFGFSGLTNWILPLGLIIDESDGATLLLWLLLINFLGDTSVLNGFVWSVAISVPSSLFLVPRFEKWDSAQFISLFFSEVLIEDSNGRWEITSFVLSFFGFTVEAVVLGWWKFCSSLAFRDTTLGTVGR